MFCVQKPWNLMIKHRHVQRRGRRSHTTVRSVPVQLGPPGPVSAVSVGATGSGPVPSLSFSFLCSFTDPQVSMDLLRAVLQPSFNDDVMAVFKKYQKVRGHGGGGLCVWGCW